MRSDEVVFDVFHIPDREFDFSLGVHDIDLGYVEESMLLRRLQVVFSAGASAGIGCVAFHNCTIDMVNEILDEGGLQEVMASGFTRADFDGDAPLRRMLQSLVDKAGEISFVIQTFDGSWSVFTSLLSAAQAGSSMRSAASKASVAVVDLIQDLLVMFTFMMILCFF